MARPSWLRAAAAMVIAASTLGRCTQVEKGGLDERAAEEARQRLDQRDSCNADNLLRLMRGTQHLADSQAFCTSYNCAQAPTVTTTVYYWTTYAYTYSTVSDASHPMYLYNLHSMTTPSPALTYANPPTPIPVPGDGNPSKKGRRGSGSGNDVGAFAGSRDKAVQARAQLAELKGRAAQAAAAAEPTSPAKLQAARAADAAAGALVDEELRRRQVVTTTATPCPTQAAPTWIAASYPPSRVSSACSCVLSSTTATSTVWAIKTAATYTETCTTYTRGFLQTSVAAICDPSLYVNAVAKPTQPTGTLGAPAVEATRPVSDRISCCQLCATTYNCVYWKWLPDHTFPADAAHFIGGFDPWDTGSCVFGYVASLPSTPVTSGPYICPNTFGHDYLDYSQGQNASWGQYESLYRQGWNQGACGNALNLYESNWECGCNWASCY